MKKHIILLFVIALLFSLQMPLALADGTSLPEYVNIGLIYGEDAVGSAYASADGFAVTDLYGDPLMSADGTTDLTVKNENGSISLYEGSSLLFTYADGIILEPVVGYISLNGTQYRGTLKFTTKGASLNAVNVVDIDSYLYGVVPKEIGGLSHIEALKAQAVTARSFTARLAGKHKADGFDLCNTIHCQVYGGVSAETAPANRAVDATSGIVATYDGKIAELYYFASDGGATESVENVWGSTDHPYLKGVDDPYETDKATHHKWSVTLSKAEINEIFADYDLGNVTDISVMETSEKGAVTSLKVTGTKGSKTFKKSECRSAFAGKAYSQAYTITKNYADEVEAPKAITTSGIVSLPSTIYVMGSDGKVIEKRIEEVTVISKSGVSKLVPDGGEVTSYTINGRGYGHLIGMSQWGARAMAEEGLTYEEILCHYYTGIELTDLRGNN